MDSDDEIESEPENIEQTDNLDHLTLAERIALKRKAEGKPERGEHEFCHYGRYEEGNAYRIKSVFLRITVPQEAKGTVTRASIADKREDSSAW